MRLFSTRIATLAAAIVCIALCGCMPGKDRGAMAGHVRMPTFPEDAPAPTASLELPSGLLVEPDAEDLDEPFRRLAEVLLAAGFKKWSVYAYKDGFALVTQWERIDAEGNPHNQRFKARHPRRIKHGFDFNEHAQLLFYAAAGDYRMFVFTIAGNNSSRTSQVPIDGNAVEPGALPEEIRNQNFADRKATAHVYVYHQAGESKARLLESSKVDAAGHLLNARIFLPAQLGR